MSLGRFVRLLTACAVLLAVMVGCGGGGGGGSGAVSVSFSPSAISSSYASGGQSITPPVANVTASVTNLPAGTVYVYVLEDAAVLAPGAYTVTRNPDGTYAVSLPFNTSLAAGTYTGNLTLRLCRDIACTSEITVTGGRIPYSVTVTPGIQISAWVNSNPVALTALQVRGGDVLSLQSTLPVSWSVASGGVNVTNQMSTTTSWSATLVYGLSSPGGTGTLMVTATSSGTPQAQKVVSISLTQ